MHYINSPNFIENLYYGHINVFERDVPPSKRHREKSDQMLKRRQALKETLSPEQEKLLEAYESAEDDLHTSSLVDHFIIGFRLGGRCLRDIFSPTDAP